MSTEQRVKEIVAEVLRQPAAGIRPEHHFIEDLGANSLDIISLVMRIEEHFGLGETPEDELEQIQTVGDVVQLVRGLRQESSVVLSDEEALVLASDHAGAQMRLELASWLEEEGNHGFLDLGPEGVGSVDYPSYAELLARKVASGESRFGVLVCGTGIGMSIAANKVEGVRAALVTDPVMAEYARRHNDANVLCLGARIIGPSMAQRCVKAFLETAFDPGDDGRHARRVNQIRGLEGT